jgi:biotin carboxylase
LPEEEAIEEVDPSTGEKRTVTQFRGGAKVVVKPANGSGSSGVTVCSNKACVEKDVEVWTETPRISVQISTKYLKRILMT